VRETVCAREIARVDSKAASDDGAEEGGVRVADVCVRESVCMCV